MRDPSIIIRMIVLQAYSHEPWPFGQMTLDALLQLASAADQFAEPYYAVRELAKREGLDPTVLDRLGRPADDLGKPVDVGELEWAKALLAELEARGRAAPTRMADDLQEARSRVRRFIDLGGSRTLIEPLATGVSDISVTSVPRESAYRVIARSCGPGTLYGDAPFDFENWSLDALIKLAAEAERLRKPPSEGLVDPTSEPPKFRAWLEAHHEKLDSDHIAFVNSLKAGIEAS